MQLHRLAFAAVSLVVPLTAPAAAQGLELRNGARVRIEQFHATAAVEEGVARVEVEELFRNDGARVEEGVFRFSLPDDAVIGAFSMWMEGREQKGVVQEAKQARATYDAIVRKQKDPGLLEQVGWRDFRVNVFPIPARDTVRVKLVYSHVVRDDLGLETLELPLPHDAGAIGDLRLHATWQAQRGLAGLDCPSHADAKLSVVEGRGEARFDSDGAPAARRFVVRALPRRGGFDVALLAHRPEGAKEGWFLARVVPRLEAPPRIGRDLIFVVDRSGSMNGEKIEQARAALRAGLASLKPGDRFDVVTFASDVTSLSEATGHAGLLDVTSPALAAARRVADDLSATGGTNIEAALGAALRVAAPAPDRLGAVIFLTDGDPTVGATQPEQLLAQWRAGCGSTRLFAFGVGRGVKEFLLTKLATEGRGAARYVEEGDDLEVPLAALYERLQMPLLLEPSFEIEGDSLVVRDREPRRLPDLCQRRALVVAGRYEGGGPARLHLRGQGESGPVDLVIPVELPAVTPERPHVAQLWAKARVERLLDDVRIGGANAELVDEVRTLGLTHQLVTPYTSFLVVEPTKPGPTTPQRRVADGNADDGTIHDRVPDAPDATRAQNVGARGPSDTTPPGVPFNPGVGAGPTTGGVPGGGMRPTSGGMGGRRGGGEGFERWEFWWEHRKEALLADARPDAHAPLGVELQRELVPALLDALRGGDAEVADAAALALAHAVPADRRYGSDHVVPALIEALRHGDEKVRRSAALALGVHGGTEAIDPLRALLRSANGSDRLQRAFAAFALGLLHADAAIDELFAAATSADVDVAALSLLALGEMTTFHDQLAPKLLALLDDRSLNTYVRAQAPLALARLHQQRPEGSPFVRALLGDLVSRFGDDRLDGDSRRSLAIALGRIATMGDVEAVAALQHAVAKGNDDQTRHFALMALAEIGARDRGAEDRRDAHAALQKWLTVELRQPKRVTHLPFAALALGVYLQNPALPADAREQGGRALLDALREVANPSYQGAAAIALGLLDWQPAAPALLRLLDRTNDAPLQGHVALALGLLRSKEAFAPLHDRLLEPQVEPRARLQFARALGLAGDRSATEPLLELLRTAPTLVEANAAAQALAALRDPAAIPPLLARLADATRPSLERSLAATALGLIADRDPLPWSARLARDVNYRAKTAAIAELLDLP